MWRFTGALQMSLEGTKFQQSYWRYSSTKVSFSLDIRVYQMCNYVYNIDHEMYLYLLYVDA